MLAAWCRFGNESAVSPFDYDKDNAVDNKCQCHYRSRHIFIGHDVFFYPVIKQKPNDGRRDSAHHNLCPNAPGVALLSFGFAP